MRDERHWFDGGKIQANETKRTLQGMSRVYNRGIVPGIPGSSARPLKAPPSVLKITMAEAPWVAASLAFSEKVHDPLLTRATFPLEKVL